MNDDCMRARGRLARWADGDLEPNQTAWLTGHWEVCAECCRDRDAFQTLDGQLRSFRETLSASAPASVERARFLSRIDQAERGRRRRLFFVPATAALLAGAALLLLSLSGPAPRSAGAGEHGFVPIPYAAPITSYERSSVVSMQIPVANLLAQGFSIVADPTSIVRADVLLGEDGNPHAVRLSPSQALRGIGE